MSFLPYAVCAGCIAAISIGQIMFKVSARSGGGSLMGVVLNPWFLSAGLLYAATTLAWVWVLNRLPLSVAFPMYGLTFIFVPLLSVRFLGEVATTSTWIGGALILLGILVAQGPSLMLLWNEAVRP